MKKINILLAAIFVLTALCVRGQERGGAEAGRLSVVQDDYYLQGDSIHLNMTISMNGVKMSRRGFVLLTPELRNDEMNVRMALPPVMINGRNRQKAYRRLVALRRAPVDVGQVIDGSDRNGPKAYRYSTAAPFEPWMRNSVFGIREDQCECNGPITPIRFTLMAKGMEDRNPAKSEPVREIELGFAVSFKVPEPEPVKNRSESGRAYLDFAVGRSELRPDFKNNAAELAGIGELIRRVDGDPHTTITRVSIDGYASPEGSYDSNLALSSRRAAALKDYIRTAYGIPEGLFRVSGRGEDWDGLAEWIEGSGRSWSDAALAIIRDTGIFDGCEKRLMELRGGAPYREMMAEVFPRLRRSDYELSYTVIPFDVEQGRRTILTNPQLMSLNEMFLVAQSYPMGSEEYDRVLDIAARLFPDNDIANLNAAANALAVKDAAEAERYLDKVAVRDAAWQNNMGVAAALKGDFGRAAELFGSARDAGNLEAPKNIAELDKLKNIE